MFTALRSYDQLLLYPIKYSITSKHTQSSFFIVYPHNHTSHDSWLSSVLITQQYNTIPSSEKVHYTIINRHKARFITCFSILSTVFWYMSLKPIYLIGMSKVLCTVCDASKNVVTSCSLTHSWRSAGETWSEQSDTKEILFENFCFTTPVIIHQFPVFINHQTLVQEAHTRLQYQGTHSHPSVTTHLRFWTVILWGTSLSIFVNAIDF
jgi:hypothetical protein